MPESRRLQSVQAPIIPVIADLIRAHPGTISLGQGVVNYGPPSIKSAASANSGTAIKMGANVKIKRRRVGAPLRSRAGRKCALLRKLIVRKR